MPPTSDRPTLAELQERVKKATRGPWIVRKARTVLHIGSELKGVAEISLTPMKGLRYDARSNPKLLEEWIEERTANADLLALAPYLLDELAASEARERDLQEENAKLRKAVAQALGEMAYYIEDDQPEKVILVDEMGRHISLHKPELWAYLREQGVQEAGKDGL